MIKINSKKLYILILLLGIHISVVCQEKKDFTGSMGDSEMDTLRTKRLQGLINDPHLFASGKTFIYKGEYLDAVDIPVGAMGGGNIRFDGKARPIYWQIFNNRGHARIPHTFLAVRVKKPDNNAIVRALQTVPAYNFQAMRELTLRGEYPFMLYDFSDPAIPVNISMEVFNPFVPLDAYNSAIPCVIFNLTVENPTMGDIDVSYLFSIQNSVGYIEKNFLKINSSRDYFDENLNMYDPNKIDGRNYETYGNNINKVIKENGTTSVQLANDISKDSVGYGNMILSLLGEMGYATASWESLNNLYAEFLRFGTITESEQAGPSDKGQTLDAAIAYPFKLSPGETKRLTFVLTWYFPNGERGRNTPKTWGCGKWGNEGNMYTNWWNSSLDIMHYLEKNLDELTRLTHLYHDTFYSTNLPHWLKDRISSQTSILRTQTCFWDKTGYFGVYEGIAPHGGACSGNCTHVWHYAQAHARLFPEIGRLMRQQDFYYMKKDGKIPYRHPNGHDAFDGQCGSILASYREHLMNTDQSWLDRYYPEIKRAMEYLIKTWDKDEDGILTGAKHNTLDSRLSGNSSWLGSLYAAALKATGEMATLTYDTNAAERYNQISEIAVQGHLNTLWNGEYFIQIPDSIPQSDYITGCAIDQMLGQWWANQLQLGGLYPVDTVNKAMRAVFKYNFKANYIGINQKPREFVKPENAGTLMITWPLGGRPKRHTSYADEVMSGFEYTAAATMIQTGNIEQSFVMLKAISDRYSGELKSGYKGNWGNWGFSGNPFGDDECGKFYGRALSSWSVLLACQGFIYNGPKSLIGFKPVWKPEDHISFFTTAEAWGLYSQSRSGRTQLHKLDISYGKISINELIFELEKGTEAVKVNVSVNNENILADFKQFGQEIKITPTKQVKINHSDTVTVKIILQ